MITKSQLLVELDANKELGLAFNQSGIVLQTKTYKDFLNWYDDAGHTRVTIDSVVNEETGLEEFDLTERFSADTRKVLSRTRYATEQEAIDTYYQALERRYQDDNGTGGIFYPNAEAVEMINAGEYDDCFEPEETEE